MKKNIKKDFIDTIGNTPLIKLNKASELTGCDIYGKAEFLNPGSSIKDRAAKGIVPVSYTHLTLPTKRIV